MTYDPDGGAVQPMLAYFLPFRAGAYDFSPQDGRGVINDGNGLFERLQWIREDGLAPLDLPVARTGSPRWSPDGTLIALDAVPPTDAEGVGRADVPRSIYLLNADGGIELTPVEDARNVGPAAWSRDGAGLLVPMELEGIAGLFLIDVSSGERTLLLKGAGFGSATWLPDGSLIVTSGVLDEDAERGLILIGAAEEAIRQALGAGR